MDGRLAFYARYTWRAVARHDVRPLIFGISPTDRCNLACNGCHLANTGRPDMTWEQLATLMAGARRRGFRELYFTGGEPTLWSDGEHDLEDAVALAHGLGFYHVHVYTNGTQGLRTRAHLMWVSVDGLPEVFARRRGDHFTEVERAIRATGHPPAVVLYTIDRTTSEGVEPFLRWVRDTSLPVRGVMFYIHTPYYGRDELYLDAAERAPLIDRLLDCRRAGLPVMNSVAGLVALKSGRWPRRLPAAVVADVDGESVCCRAPAECCCDCGYAACTEIAEALRLRPSAVLAMGRYW